MKRISIVIMILVFSFTITGCVNQIILPPNDATIQKVEYKTYGAFTLPETNQQTLIIDENSMIFVLAAFNGSETFRHTRNINDSDFRKIIDTINENGFAGWDTNQTADLLITDVGVAEITVQYDDGSSKTVKFDPNVPSEYGSEMEEVLDILNKYKEPFWKIYTDTLPQAEIEFVQIKYQPMQCEDAPWEEWYKEGNIQFIQAPTDEELIYAYYGEQGISIENVSKVEPDIFVCEACIVCPTSHHFTAEADNNYISQMEGWILAN